MLRPWTQAARSLARRPAFAISAILILGAGIAATTGAFSIVDAAVLAPLPYPNPDRLVVVLEANSAKTESAGLLAPARIEDWNRMNRTFDVISGSYSENVTESSGESPERLAARRVAPRLLLSPPYARTQLTAPLRVQRLHNRPGDDQSMHWLGDVTVCGPVTCEDSASVALDLATLYHLRLGPGATVGAAALLPFGEQGLDRHADLSLDSRIVTLWAGRTANALANGAATSRGARLGYMEYGGELRWRKVGVAVAVGSGRSRSSAIVSLPPRFDSFVDSASGAIGSDTTRSTDSSAGPRAP